MTEFKCLKVVFIFNFLEFNNEGNYQLSIYQFIVLLIVNG